MGLRSLNNVSKIVFKMEEGVQQGLQVVGVNVGNICPKSVNFSL